MREKETPRSLVRNGASDGGLRPFSFGLFYQIYADGSDNEHHTRHYQHVYFRGSIPFGVNSARILPPNAAPRFAGYRWFR